MKILDYDGSWVGLGYFEHEYMVDYRSNPDNWKIGFDIVYRLDFKLNEAQFKDSSRLKISFIQAFKSAFGLPDDHFETDQWNGGVFWRIYWDKDAFDLRLLKKCEEYLNACAEENKTQIILLGMSIIPRSLENISQTIKFNLKK